MTQDSGEEHNLEYRQARIRQANALAKSGQELDLNEKRLLLLTMARIKSNDTELLTHKISMKELAVHLGDNPYARAERAARGLLRRLVYILTENGGFREFQWTTVAEYVPAESSETGESYVKIRLNEELAPLLLELRERYNTISLLDIVPMESFNGQRLYEILWHDSHGGDKKVLTYNVADLKFSMGMRVLEQKGSRKVWTEKYKAWRDFRKMLERAAGEFEAHGRLRFSFDAIRQGRAIQQVRFHLSLVDSQADAEASRDPSEPRVTLTPEERVAVDDLRALGYTQDAEALVSKHGHEVVKRAIMLGRAAEARGSSSGRPINNVPGFIQHLVSSGAAARSLNLGSSQKRDRRADDRELIEVIKVAFESYQSEVANELYDRLDDDTKHALPEMLRVDLETQNRTYIVDVLDKAGWQGAQYEIARNAYLLELYRDQLPDAAFDIATFLQERQLLTGRTRKEHQRILEALRAELESQ